MIGQDVAQYRILAKLGAGGMGIVYLAQDARLERRVALKVLPTEFARDEERVARFEREAKAISALSHPHICHLYDIGSQDGTDYLVMELLEGESLADRLQKGPLPLKQALQGCWSRRITAEHRMVYQVAKGELLIMQLRYHY